MEMELYNRLVDIEDELSTLNAKIDLIVRAMMNVFDVIDFEKLGILVEREYQK